MCYIVNGSLLPSTRRPPHVALRIYGDYFQCPTSYMVQRIAASMFPSLTRGRTLRPCGREVSVVRRDGITIGGMHRGVGGVGPGGPSAGYGGRYVLHTALLLFTFHLFVDQNRCLLSSFLNIENSQKIKLFNTYKLFKRNVGC
jgi:hypothetical protein